MATSIKQKIGRCIDCPEDDPEKPLIAKRCKTHYWQHRAKLKNPKSAWKEEKRKEMKTFLSKPRKPIPKVSKKRAVENAKYTVKKIIFMSKPENKICPVTGQPTTDIHHKAGRVGFADSWARINNIPLLLDERFWLAVSREGHRQIEEQPEWAKENGYSLKRLSNEKI
jgi:hypothetical protein